MGHNVVPAGHAAVSPLAGVPLRCSQSVSQHQAALELRRKVWSVHLVERSCDSLIIRSLFDHYSITGEAPVGRGRQAFVNKHGGGRNARWFAPERIRELAPSERGAAEAATFLSVEGLGRIPFSNVRRPRPLMDVAAPAPKVPPPPARALARTGAAAREGTLPVC